MTVWGIIMLCCKWQVLTPVWVNNADWTDILLSTVLMSPSLTIRSFCTSLSEWVGGWEWRDQWVFCFAEHKRVVVSQGIVLLSTRVFVEWMGVASKCCVVVNKSCWVSCCFPGHCVDQDSPGAAGLHQGGGGTGGTGESSHISLTTCGTGKTSHSLPGGTCIHTQSYTYIYTNTCVLIVFLCISAVGSLFQQVNYMLIVDLPVL